VTRCGAWSRRRARSTCGERVLAKGRFGGGDLTTTDDDAMAPYLEQLLPEVFSFYRTGAARR
jgi:hypothetical protein